MTLQVRKHKDGRVELLSEGKSLAVLSQEQVKSLIDVLTAAARG